MRRFVAFAACALSTLGGAKARAEPLSFVAGEPFPVAHLPFAGALPQAQTLATPPLRDDAPSDLSFTQIEGMSLKAWKRLHIGTTTVALGSNTQLFGIATGTSVLLPRVAMSCESLATPVPLRWESLRSKRPGEATLEIVDATFSGATCTTQVNKRTQLTLVPLAAYGDLPLLFAARTENGVLLVIPPGQSVAAESMGEAITIGNESLTRFVLPLHSGGTASAAFAFWTHSMPSWTQTFEPPIPSPPKPPSDPRRKLQAAPPAPARPAQAPHEVVVRLNVVDAAADTGATALATVEVLR